MGRIPDFDYFYNKYKPKTNPFVEENQIMFETFENEVNYVKNQNPKHIWTVVEGEGGKWYITYGYHIVNRIGYLITEIPWTEGLRDYLY